jgi:hypothetical protein
MTETLSEPKRNKDERESAEKMNCAKSKKKKNVNRGESNEKT